MSDPAAAFPYKIKMKRLQRLDGLPSHAVSWEVVATGRRAKRKVIGCGSATDREAATAQIEALINENHKKETEVSFSIDISEGQQSSRHGDSLVSIKLDREVLAYFRKNNGRRYQACINTVLRDFVEDQRSKALSSSAD